MKAYRDASTPTHSRSRLLVRRTFLKTLIGAAGFVAVDSLTAACRSGTTSVSPTPGPTKPGGKLEIFSW